MLQEALPAVDLELRADEHSAPLDEDVALVADGEITATNSLAELGDALLMINSDLFITGARGLSEISVPAVIEALEGVPFRVRGYPESHKEKLVLILISREIERLALETGSGRIRTGLQELQRIEDELGTRKAYQQLDDSAVDVHLYGAPGWNPPPGSSITVHAGYQRERLDSWFVVFRSPSDEEAAALVAVEEGANDWYGCWTTNRSVVEEIDEDIATRF